VNDSQRHFLKRQAKVFAELAQAHLPWVLDGMEPQNRRSVEARRQTMAAGLAIGISYLELAGFFRIDRSTVFRAITEGPVDIATAEPGSLSVALVEPHGKTPLTVRKLAQQARRLRKTA